MSDLSVSKQISSQRLISLDALRGFTIAAMVIVNDPGSWDAVYAPLLHASWHGVTATDLIFPFFIFIVGVSISFAYTKRMEAKVPKRDIYKKIIWRAFKIYAVGIFLWVFGRFDFIEFRLLAEIRWVGVLQRIAIVFLLGALIFLNTDWKKQIIIAATLLIGYWLIMALIPVPIDDVIKQALASGTVMSAEGEIAIGELKQLSEGFIAANFEPGTNLAAWLDRAAVPGYLWQKTWDPEGLLSTIPALVTAIIGMLVGRIILTIKEPYKKLSYLFFTGFSLLLVGELWSYIFPVNKNLWTSSFTLFTAGLATMGLAACILIIDIWGYKGWTRLGRVYGANAITAYVLAGMLTLVFYSDRYLGISLSRNFMEAMTGIGVPDKFASFMYAIIYMLIIYIPTYILYRKKIFIKL
jgi:predicted acyltransferase